MFPFCCLHFLIDFARVRWLKTATQNRVGQLEISVKTTAGAGRPERASKAERNIPQFKCQVGTQDSGIMAGSGSTRP